MASHKTMRLVLTVVTVASVAALASPLMAKKGGNGGGAGGGGGGDKFAGLAADVEIADRNGDKLRSDGLGAYTFEEARGNLEGFQVWIDTRETYVDLSATLRAGSEQLPSGDAEWVTSLSFATTKSQPRPVPGETITYIQPPTLVFEDTLGRTWWGYDGTGALPTVTGYDTDNDGESDQFVVDVPAVMEWVFDLSFYDENGDWHYLGDVGRYSIPFEMTFTRREDIQSKGKR